MFQIMFGIRDIGKVFIAQGSRFKMVIQSKEVYADRDGVKIAIVLKLLN